MYKTQSFRLSVNEHVTSAGQQILCVLEKQHRYYSSEHVRVFVGQRLQSAARSLCDLFSREMEDLDTLLQQHYSTLLRVDLRMDLTAEQSVESSLQVKMSSPVLLAARSLSVKQEPEDHLYLNFENLPKEEEKEVSPERQERRSPSGLVQEEEEEEEPEETLHRHVEEAGGSTRTSLAVKCEGGGGGCGQTEPLAGISASELTSSFHAQAQVDEDDCGALQPPSDDQLLLRSHPYESDAEYSGEWGEEVGGEDRSAQSNELSQGLISVELIPSTTRDHRGETPVSCTVCGKLFAFGGHLVRHMRTHTGEKPFSCAVCGKSFNQSEILTRHLKTHTAEKIFNCPVCGKSFNRTGNLKTHMRIHTGEKPFNCAVCGKRFTLKCHLKTHMRIHTGEKPFTCAVCCKGFGQKSGLERHMRSHTGGGYL